MFKNIFGASTFSCLLLLAVFSAHAGIVVGGTRFIYSGSRESISFNVKNTSSDVYLVQTKIMSDNRDTALPGPQTITAETPFIASPPLFRLNPLHENSVRIIKIAGNLPQNRESLFWLTVAGIPAAEQQNQNNTVQIAMRHRMKLFYRPANLPGDAKKAYAQLMWSRQGKNVVVQNPTPYFVTLLTLTVNGQTVNTPGMVSPYSSLNQPWCPESGECNLQWQAIDDFGAATSPLHIAVNATPHPGQS